MNDVNKIFHKVPVEIPNKSGFDMSFENLLTAKVGTLTPALCEFLLPNDTITLGANLQVQLPPMATDFYGRISAKMEAFFVPARLLYGGWQEIMTHPTQGAIYPAGSSEFQRARFLPYFVVDSNLLAAGTLADYLGVKLTPAVDSTRVKVSNPLPFLAYHKIWSDWYRDTRIQKDCFERPTPHHNATSNFGNFSFSPYTTRGDSVPVEFTTSLSDGIRLTTLRQRNWGKDYFTNATPLPQAGQGSNLAFSVNTPSGQTNGTGTFSIASLRAANAIQTWMERNNLAGYRYGDQIKARFGVYPSDAILDRSIYLGSVSIDVYNKSIYQTGQTSQEDQVNNPFKSVASKYGSPQGYGEGSLVDSFTATEYGYLFVMYSLVPYAYYGTGSRKHFMCNCQADFPDPLLAGVGDEPIYNFELGEDLYAIDESSGIFGYTQRFSDYKFVNDQVHGLLRDGQSLKSFALQRSFANALGVSLDSSFLQIPTNFLDQVSAVESSVSEYGCWADIYFKFKKASTLPAYSIPTLGDMKDTHTEIIDNGGKRL